MNHPGSNSGGGSNPLNNNSGSNNNNNSKSSSRKASSTNPLSSQIKQSALVTNTITSVTGTNPIHAEKQPQQASINGNFEKISQVSPAAAGIALQVSPLFLKSFIKGSEDKVNSLVEMQKKLLLQDDSLISENSAAAASSTAVAATSADQSQSQKTIPSAKIFDYAKMITLTFICPIIPSIPQNFSTKTPSFTSIELIECLSELKPAHLVAFKKKQQNQGGTGAGSNQNQVDWQVLESEAPALIRKHAVEGQKALVLQDYRRALIQLKRGEIVMNALGVKDPNKVEADLILFLKANLGICYYRIGILSEAFTCFCVCLANLKKQKSSFAQTNFQTNNSNVSHHQNHHQQGIPAPQHTLKKRSYSQLPNSADQADYLQTLAMKLKQKRLKGDLLLQLCIVLSEQGNHEDALVVGKKASKLHLNCIIDTLTVSYHMLVQIIKESESSPGQKAQTTRRGYSAHTKGAGGNGFNNTGPLQTHSGQTGGYNAFDGDFHSDLNRTGNMSSFKSSGIRDKISYLEKVVPILKEVMKRTVDLQPQFVSGPKLKILELLGKHINNNNQGENNSRSTSSSNFQDLSQSGINGFSVSLYERADLEFLFATISTRNHWILKTNILSLLQLKSVSLEETQISRTSIDQEILIDSILNKIAHLCVSFYCISTETRFISDQKKNAQKAQGGPQTAPTTDQNSVKYQKFLANLNYSVSESENWLSRSLEIAYIFLPHDMPLVGQIVSVHNKFHNVNKIVIHEDDAELDTDRSRDTDTNEPTNQNSSYSSAAMLAQMEYASPLVTLPGGSKSNFFIPMVRKIKPLQKPISPTDIPSAKEEEIALLYKINIEQGDQKPILSSDSSSNSTPTSNSALQEQQIQSKNNSEDHTIIASSLRVSKEKFSSSSINAGPAQFQKRSSEELVAREKQTQASKQSAKNSKQEQQTNQSFDTTQHSSNLPDHDSVEQIINRLSKTTEIPRVPTNQSDLDDQNKFHAIPRNIHQYKQQQKQSHQQQNSFQNQQTELQSSESLQLQQLQQQYQTQQQTVLNESKKSQQQQFRNEEKSQQNFLQMLDRNQIQYLNPQTNTHSTQSQLAQQQQLQMQQQQQQQQQPLHLTRNLSGEKKRAAGEQQKISTNSNNFNAQMTFNRSWNSNQFAQQIQEKQTQPIPPSGNFIPQEQKKKRVLSLAEPPSTDFGLPFNAVILTPQSSTGPSSEQTSFLPTSTTGNGQSQLKKLFQKPLSQERKYRTIDMNLNSMNSSNSHFINNVSELLNEMNFPLSSKNAPPSQSSTAVSTTRSQLPDTLEIKRKSSTGFTTNTTSQSQQSQQLSNQQKQTQNFSLIPPSVRSSSLTKPQSAKTAPSPQIKPSSAKPTLSTSTGSVGIDKVQSSQLHKHFQFNTSGELPLKSSAATTMMVMKNNFIANDVFGDLNTGFSKTQPISMVPMSPGIQSLNHTHNLNTSNSSSNNNNNNNNNALQQQLINQLSVNNKSSQNIPQNMLKRPNSKENEARSNSSRNSSAARKNKKTHLDIDTSPPMIFHHPSSGSGLMLSDFNGSKSTRNTSTTGNYLSDNYLNLIKGSQSTKASAQMSSPMNNASSNFLGHSSLLSSAKYTNPPSSIVVSSAKDSLAIAPQGFAMTARNHTPKQIHSNQLNTSGTGNDKKQHHMLRKFRTTAGKVPDDLLKKK